MRLWILCVTVNYSSQMEPLFSQYSLHVSPNQIEHPPRTSPHLQQQLPSGKYSIWLNNVSLLFMSPCLRGSFFPRHTSAELLQSSLCWLCWVGTAARVVTTIDGQRLFSQANSLATHNWSVWDWRERECIWDRVHSLSVQSFSLEGRYSKANKDVLTWFYNDWVLFFQCKRISIYRRSVPFHIMVTQSFINHGITFCFLAGNLAAQGVAYLRF